MLDKVQKWTKLNIVGGTDNAFIIESDLRVNTVRSTEWGNTSGRPIKISENRGLLPHHRRSPRRNDKSRNIKAQPDAEIAPTRGRGGFPCNYEVCHPPWGIPFQTSAVWSAVCHCGAMVCLCVCVVVGGGGGAEVRRRRSRGKGRQRVRDCDAHGQDQDKVDAYYSIASRRLLEQLDLEPVMHFWACVLCDKVSVFLFATPFFSAQGSNIAPFCFSHKDFRCDPPAFA